MMVGKFACAHWTRRVVVGSGCLLLAAWLVAGCLDRPVGPAAPRTTNIYTRSVPHDVVDKIDLLFMIDTSISMADKQAILAQAIPVLVRRLVSPSCVDSQNRPVGAPGADGRCVTGELEFQPVKDIHIGVITSSLGGFGGTQCRPAPEDAASGRTPDDRAELLPAARPAAGLRSWNGQGFLAWDPGQNKNQPPGEANLEALIDDFTRQVDAAGEFGCGFEASLESWYRFLVDPDPPVSIATSGGVQNVAVRGPRNEALLAQRRAFLRPDSLLAIVMLTDENDCSVLDTDGTQGFLVTSPGQMPRSSAACALDPNDRCCHTCALAAPEGCVRNEEDAECSRATSGNVTSLAPSEDSTNLRCFEHKRRFGIDLLHPVERYIDGLKNRTVKNRAGVDVPNPIFTGSDGTSQRTPSHVILAGIVGVPWQDVATEESLSGPGLAYMSADELATSGRWDVILGDASRRIEPDPLMKESVAPRSGIHPIVGVPLAPATSMNPRENPINGHEQNVVGQDDLQYACTFELPVPHVCGGPNQGACDCNSEKRAYNRPLCDFSAAAAGAHGLQRFAKAYPGRRHLEVLRGVGGNGVVASICPKNVAAAPGLVPDTDPNYGYNPAIAALLELIGERLGGQCLPRALAPDSDMNSETFGQVPCAVVQAIRDDSGACNCGPGRSPVTSSDLRDSVRQALAANDQCGDNVACSSYCLCEVAQLSGEALAACQAGSFDPNLYGYCYVDAAQGIGNPSLVEPCPSTDRRMLRFVGTDLPADGSTTLISCFGASLASE